MDLGLIFLSIIFIIIGYSVAFYGLKIKNLLFVFVWFLIGFTISNEIFSDVFKEIDMLHTFSTLIGLVCSLFSYKLEKINIFVITSWMVGASLYSKLQFDANINLIFSIIIGIIVGLLALKFVKILVIIATAIMGGTIMIRGISILPFYLDSILLIAIQIFIIILGCIYQFRTNKNES